MACTQLERMSSHCHWAAMAKESSRAAHVSCGPHGRLIATCLVVMLPCGHALQMTAAPGGKIAAAQRSPSPCASVVVDETGMSEEQLRIEIAGFKAEHGMRSSSSSSTQTAGGASEPELSPLSVLNTALTFNLFNFAAKSAPGLGSIVANSEDWARVYGRMAAKSASTRPPPLSPWHDPDARLFPGLSTHPFHEPSDPWWRSEVADAVALLERFYPVIKQEALALSGRQALPQYRDHGDALLHEDGDWQVHYLSLEGKDTRMQVGPPSEREHAHCERRCVSR